MYYSHTHTHTHLNIWIQWYTYPHQPPWQKNGSIHWLGESTQIPWLEISKCSYSVTYKNTQIPQVKDSLTYKKHISIPLPAHLLVECWLSNRQWSAGSVLLLYLKTTTEIRSMWLSPCIYRTFSQLVPLSLYLCHKLSMFDVITSMPRPFGWRQVSKTRSWTRSLHDNFKVKSWNHAQGQVKVNVSP